MRRVLGLSLLAAVTIGCAPSIGDSCSSALDCSINGDRQCDSTRPGGACTIFGCEADTCPDDAVCVRFRPEPSRLTFTACMRRCEMDGNCRFDDGYRCRSGEAMSCSADEDCLGGTCTDGACVSDGALAEVIDIERGQQRFCVATQAPNTDAGM